MSQLAIPSTSEPLRLSPSASADGVAARRAEGRSYRIGPVPVRLRCPLPEVTAQFHEHYAAYELPAAPPEAFRIDVQVRRSPRTLRRYYHVLADGEELFAVRSASAVLPHVEWALNQLIARYLPHYLQIHAAVMSREGVGVILAGSPGRGKTTLAAALLAGGWSYLSDEFALIDPDTRLVHPYPKALCIKAGSFAALRGLGLPIATAPAHVKGRKGPVAFVDPLRVRPDAVSEPCRIGAVVFPEHEVGAPPAIEPLPPARALFELTQVSFNLSKFRRSGFELLADVIGDAGCWHLRSGELEATCALLTRAIRNRATGGRA